MAILSTSHTVQSGRFAPARSSAVAVAPEGNLVTAFRILVRGECQCGILARRMIDKVRSSGYSAILVVAVQ